MGIFTITEHSLAMTLRGRANKQDRQYTSHKLKESEATNSLYPSKGVTLLDRPRGYKTFFMLSLAENSSANKYENAN